MRETIGQRIAEQRRRMGWTQQQVADQIAISRVAISHIESDLSVPGERTITLLAGLFKCPPHDLVADTTYPQAKAERLPANTNWYTELDLKLALLDRDLGWLKRLASFECVTGQAEAVRQHWLPMLGTLERGATTVGERERVSSARRELLELGKTEAKSQYSQVSPVRQ